MTNPATGEIVGRVKNFTVAQTQHVIDQAAGRRSEWEAAGAKNRAQALFRWRDAIQNKRDDLAQLVTCESGKPLQEAHSEVDYAAAYISWFAAEASDK